MTTALHCNSSLQYKDTYYWSPVRCVIAAWPAAVAASRERFLSASVPDRISV